MSEPLTPEILAYGLVQSVEPQVSPDGRELLYARVSVDPTTHRRSRELRRCMIDGSGDRPMLGEGGGASPRWSPDGRSIAFTRAVDGGNGLFLMSRGPETQSARELAWHAEDIGDLAWSPDSERLVYTSAVDPAASRQRGTAEAGPPRVRVTSRLDYKQDGRGFVGENRVQIFVVDAATGPSRQVSTRPFDHHGAAWSPDGRQVATSVVHTAGSGPELCVIDVASGAVRWFEPPDARVELVAWSLRGDRLAFTANPADELQPQFYIASVTTGTAIQLTRDLPSLPTGTLRWVDEGHILFQGVRGGASGLELLDAESGDVSVIRRWTARNGPLTADRSGDVLAWSFDTLTEHGELRVFKRSSDMDRVITSNNAEVLRSHPPAQWERFDIQRGTFTIEAWLLKPPDFDEGKRYPVILDVHGGPTGHYAYAFMAHQQVWASNGFLVVFANARGSDTYGREFVQQVVHDWGGEDYRDYLAVLDEVLKRPYADAERTAIYGYSYGGYVCSWALGHTDRFKAAVCGAPIFDLVSAYGTVDYSGRGLEVHIGGRPHENRDEYIRRSPSTYIHRATTPTLVIEGEEDHRCPMNQAEQLFVLLKKAGVETLFARYPAGSHMFFAFGIPEHRADFLARTLSWYQDHLAPAELAKTGGVL
ncbi:MAG: S9 family peptidase [Chloroflexota bacterium]|nr:S9 family peptidase [Chloroflexota bacterium]